MNRADRRTTAAAPEFSHPSGEEARLVDDGDDYSSGASTPPLWRAASPPPHTSSSGGDLAHYRSLSPAARTQAIARGQRELMEMVSRMPEGCYELSLKDLVEHQYQIGIENPPPAAADRKLSDGGGGGGGKVRWAVSNNPVAGAKISRSGSLDNGGFLLKMGLPVSSLRSRNGSKKKTNPYAGGKAGSQKDGRISPTGKSGGGGVVGMAEKEWWKDESESFAGFSSYSDSRSSKSSSHGSSSRSSSINSSSNNNNRRRSGGCCLFFWSTKVKVAD